MLCKYKVKGSSPFSFTMEVLNKFVLPVNKKTNVWFKETLILATIWGCSSNWREQVLCKHKVEGSSPFSSTQYMQI